MAKFKKRITRLTGPMQFKLFIVFAVIITAFVVLVGRLIYINLQYGNEYSKIVLSSQKNDSVTIPFERGKIYDRNKRTLVTNEKIYSLILEPKNILDKDGKYLSPTLKALNKYFGYDLLELNEVVNDNKDSYYLVYQKGLTYGDVSDFMEFMELADESVKGKSEQEAKQIEAAKQIRGINFEESYKRVYKYNSLACRVLGFTSAGNVGNWGIEQSYNDELNGVNGRKYYYFDETLVLEESVIDAKDGNNVVSTIDMDIQQIIEKNLAIYDSKIGSKMTNVLVMDPQSGEILGMASSNPYNLNEPMDETALKQIFSMSEIEDMKLYTEEKAREKKNEDDEDDYGDYNDYDDSSNDISETGELKQGSDQVVAAKKKAKTTEKKKTTKASKKKKKASKKTTTKKKATKKTSKKKTTKKKTTKKTSKKKTTKKKATKKTSKKKTTKKKTTKKASKKTTTKKKTTKKTSKKKTTKKKTTKKTTAKKKTSKSSKTTTASAGKSTQATTVKKRFSKNQKTIYDGFYELWRNSIISNTNEPGSTYKPFTVAAGLESGILTGDENYYCSGSLPVGRRNIGCSHVHGAINLKQAVSLSCNVAMMNIAFKEGVDTFYSYQNQFGFGRKTGVDLPGEAFTENLVYNAENYSSDATLATNSFGQNFNCTMMQMAAGFCSLINGGNYYKPHIVKQIQNSDGAVVRDIGKTLVRKTVSEETSRKLRSYLKDTVENGTGQKGQIPGYSIGGKTGTAEKIPRNKEDYYISFIGFTPVKNPQLLIYVTIDEPHVKKQDNAALAVQLEKACMEDILDLMGIEPTEKENKSSGVPEEKSIYD